VVPFAAQAAVKRVSLTGVSTEERQLKKLANLVRNAL
jgi:hypothetical protein